MTITDMRAGEGRLPPAALAKWILVASAIAFLLLWLVIAGNRTDAAAAEWAAGDVLQIEAVTVEADGTRTGVTLSWPVPTGTVDSFEVRREGVLVETVSGTTYTALDKAPDSGDIAQSYTVAAIVGGVVDNQLGGPEVRFPDPATGCTIVWTGGASSSWAATANWAPYGLAGSEGPVRAPNATDHACVDHRLGLPITVDTANNVTDQFTGTQFRPETLRIESGDLRILGTATIPALQMAGGKLQLADDSKLLWAAGRPELRLGGGELIIDTVLEIVSSTTGGISGDIVAVSGTTTVLNGGELIAQSMGFDNGGTKAVVGRDGHITRIQTDLDLTGDNSFTVGAGGATLIASGIEIDSGTTTIDWEVDGGPTNGLFINSDGGRLVLADLSELAPGDTFLDAGRIDLRGEVEFAEQLERLGGRLDVQQAAGKLTSGGAATAFAGLRQADALRIDGAVVSIDGNLTVDDLDLRRGSELYLDGALADGPGSFNRFSVDQSILSVGVPSTLPPDSTLKVGELAVFHGDFTAEGEVIASEQDDAAGYADAVFKDDLTLTDTSTLVLGARGPGSDNASELRVEGTLTVDGELDIEVVALLPDPTDLLLVATDKPPVGSFDTTTVRGSGSADTAAEVLDDGIHVTSGGSPVGGTCAENLPALGTMPVKGCWIELSRDVWATYDSVITEPGDIPAIGGLTFDPAVGVDLTLDLSNSTAPRLFADNKGGTGFVGVSLALDAPSVTEVIDLGDTPLDWLLDGSENSIGIPDFLAMPVATSTVAVGDTWSFSVDVVLPEVLDNATVRIDLLDTGRGITDPIQGQLSVTLAEVEKFNDTELVYQGSALWSIGNSGADGPIIDGQLEYGNGLLKGGTLGLSDVAIGGFGSIDAVLAWNPVGTMWTSDTTASDGQPFVRLVETGLGGVGDTSRFVIGDVELGLATVKGLVLVRDTVGWSFEGTAGFLGGSSQPVSSVGLRFDGGVLTEGEIQLAGSFGELADLQNLTLTRPATTTPDPTLDKSAVLYDLSAQVLNGGRTIPTAGSLTMLDGELADLALPLDIEFGELGSIVGVLGFDKGTFPLTGADPLSRADYTCEGRTAQASSNMVLVGGEPVSGALTISELCLGPFTLTDTVVSPSSSAADFALEATVGGRSVSGELSFNRGSIVGGQFDLPLITIGEWFSIPATTLNFRDRGPEDIFEIRAASPGDPVRGLEFTFRNGQFVSGEIGLGDISLGDPDLAGLVAEARGLLPIGGLDLTYDLLRKNWIVDGFLDDPAVNFTGSLALIDGNFESGGLSIPGINIGSLAEIDLQLDVSGPTSFSVSGVVQGPAFEGSRAATGELTFANGNLSSGELEIDDLPIGDLIHIENFRLTAGVASWQLSGAVASDGGDAALAGSMTFVGGDLTKATLDLTNLQLGPSVVDRLSFVLDRSTGLESYDISGVVRGPSQSSGGQGVATLVEFAGSATIANGELVGFNTQIPYLEIGSLVYLENLNLSYLDVGGQKTLFGTGAATTADETGPTLATLRAVVDGGFVREARITANNLSLGGLVTIDDFLLDYNRDAPLSCEGVTVGRDTVYAISGTAAGGGAVTGCVALDGRTMIGGELDIERLAVGELFEVEALSARFSSLTTDKNQLVDAGGASVPGGVDLSRTALDLTANIRAGTLDPVSVNGAIEFTDGGLSMLEFSVPRLPLSATVALVDLELAYDQAGRWDGVSDTSFRLTGSAEHDAGTTSAVGDLTFSADGMLTEAQLSVADLPLGPISLDRFDLMYSGGSSTSWVVGGQVTAPGGAPVALGGSATIFAGRIEEASLDIPRISIGELVLLSDARFEFRRDTDGSERWSATTSVSGLGQASDPATGTFEVVIAPDGSLDSGFIAVDHVEWGGLFTVENLTLSGAPKDGQFVWDLDAKVAIGDGGDTELSGQLVLSDGVVQSGSISMSGVKIDEFATIDSLDLLAGRVGDSTSWAADLLVTPGDGQQIAAAGEMSWSLGRLESARLELGNIDVAELFAIESLVIDFENGRRWAATARLADSDGNSAVDGELTFTDGALTSGRLGLTDVQLGPIELSEFDLLVDTTGTAAATACGVPDPGGPGSRYAIDATVRSADGDSTSLGGRFRIDRGTFVEGVLCGDDIQIADMILLDDLVVAYSVSGSGAQRSASFDGTATVANPDEPSDTWSATVGFEIRDRQLQRFDLSAGGLNLGELLTLDDLELHFDRSADASNWNLAATLQRPGPDDTEIAGALQIVDGTIVGGNLQIADLPVGDLFTLTDLQIDFFGRRATTDPGSLPPFVGAGANTTCAAIPSDNNVPSGIGSTTGGESLFTIAARVEANGDTFAARGSMSLADGRLTSFDITLACLPLGDFKTLEGARVAYRENLFVVSARLRDAGTQTRGQTGLDLSGQNEGTSSASGELVFNNGRLVGGELVVLDMPLGIVQIDRFEMALGENPIGDTTFGLTLVVENDSGPDFGGGGSLTMRDGRVVSGSLQIAELPFLDIFRIEDFEIEVDGSVPNRTFFAGGANVVLGGGGSAGMAISMTFENGRMVQGSFEASQVDLFEVVPLGSFSIAFDSVERSWSGSMDASLPGVGSGQGPGIQLGVEFQRGKLVSGVFGFDANGDGEVDGLNSDGSAPASGGGDFTGLPLKALYVRYCAPNSAAAFCDPIDNDTWEGRIGFELPTDGAPGLDASIRLRNGKFEAARVEIEGLSIPVYPGVFLNALRAAVEINPRLLFGGGVGVTVGLPSGAFDIATVDANLQFSEEPAPDPNQDPDAYEPEYLRFYTEGIATFLELPINLFSFVDVQTRGFVGVGGRIDFELIGNVLYVAGGAEGYVFDAGALGLTHPRTGAPLTGPSAQVIGFTEARILGVNILRADFVANTIGVMGCAEINLLITEVRIGAGIYWSDGDTRLTCDMGLFEIAGVSSTGGVFTQNLASGLNAGADDHEFSTFDVPAGEDVLGVEVEGVGGTPEIELVAPDGTVYDIDDSDPSDGVLIATSPGKRWFIIGDPQPGEWRVDATPTSVPLGEVAVSLALPPVDVSGTVTPQGGSFVLDYQLTEIPGQQVVFIERSTDPSDGFTSALGAASGANGQLDFTPGGAVTGGEREIVAQVLQDGFLRAEVVIATIDIPNATPASPPLDLSVTEVVSGARVTWEAPESNGGRTITSYRISSTAGWSVTTDDDERSAYLPIPGLVPGEEVPVIVQARTGTGWGEPATVYFVASQTTSFQYAFGEIPDTVLTRPLPGGDPTPPDPPTPPTTIPPTPPTTIPPIDNPSTPVAITPQANETPSPPTTEPLSPAGTLPSTGGGGTSLLLVAIALVLGGVALLISRRSRFGRHNTT